MRGAICKAMSCFHLASLIILAFVVATFLRTENGFLNDVTTPENLVFFKDVTKNSTVSAGRCNFFSGRWIYDDVSYPLYREAECSLISEEFSCEKYGRPNLTFQNWRWQPHDCDLPRFNGTALLEKLRNKRMVYTGDSINRNQFRSLLCLVEPSVPPSTNKTVVTDLEENSLKFYVKDYNASFEFHWAPYLVESGADNIANHSQKWQRWVRIESITAHGRRWSDADVLVFDTHTWWIPNQTVLWGPFDSPNPIYQQVDDWIRSYEIALETWSNWLEYNIDRDKTKMYFMSFTPFRQGNTYQGTSGVCYNTTEPEFDGSLWEILPRFVIRNVGSAIEKLKKRGVTVEYLNITQLSSYRDDAHPSVYLPFWKSIDPKARDPDELSDCVHWCLPGVPDVWNQILYGYIMEP